MSLILISQTLICLSASTSQSSHFSIASLTLVLFWGFSCWSWSSLSPSPLTLLNVFQMNHFYQSLNTVFLTHCYTALDSSPVSGFTTFPNFIRNHDKDSSGESHSCLSIVSLSSTSFFEVCSSSVWFKVSFRFGEEVSRCTSTEVSCSRSCCWEWELENSVDCELLYPNGFHEESEPAAE